MKAGRAEGSLGSAKRPVGGEQKMHDCDIDGGVQVSGVDVGGGQRCASQAHAHVCYAKGASPPASSSVGKFGLAFRVRLVVQDRLSATRRAKGAIRHVYRVHVIRPCACPCEAWPGRAAACACGFCARACKWDASEQCRAACGARKRLAACGLRAKSRARCPALPVVSCVALLLLLCPVYMNPMASNR